MNFFQSLVKAKVPIFWPDRESCGSCYIPGPKASDLAQMMPQLVKNADSYLLLLFHAGRNDITSQNLGRIKEDYKTLEVQMKNGAQITFSSISRVREKDAARKRCIMQFIT